MDSYFSDPLSAHEAGRQHHLLRHSLPQEERGNESVLRHFDTESVSEAFKAIKKMSQRDLQAKFKVVRALLVHMILRLLIPEDWCSAVLCFSVASSS